MRGPAAAFQTVTGILRAIARDDPDRVAVTARGAGLSYGELDQLSNQIGNGILDRLGPDPEAVVILCADPTRTVAAMIGILKSGKFWTTLDHTTSPEVAASRLDDTAARLIVTDCEAGVRLARERGVATLRLDQFRSAANESMLAGATADALACIIYTSGSSGRPKGVMRSLGALLHAARASSDRTSVRPDDRIVLLGSLTWGSGISSLFRCLLSGATGYLFPLREAGFSALAELIVAEEITIYHSVPTVFRQFLSGLGADARFPSVRLVQLAGEPVTAQDVELFLAHLGAECLFVNNLGATEATSFLRCELDRTVPTEVATPFRFRPASRTEILLLDEQGDEVSKGEVGEIAVQSAGLALGYWRRPDETAAVFLSDPAGSGRRTYRTRDLGRLMEDGSIEHLGRSDQQIKLRGQLVDVAAANEAFQTIVANDPDLSEGVILVRELRRHGHRLVAYVAPAAGRTPDRRQVRERCAAILPEAMVPNAVVLLPRLPTGPDGALLQDAIPELRESDLLLGGRARPARLVTEDEIIAIFRELLDLESVGIDDSFFDLGGDSLLALRLVLELEKRFHTTLSAESLFQAHTPLSLAALIERAEQDGERSMEVMHAGAPARPLFGVGGVGGSVMMIVEVARRLGAGQPVYGLHPPGMNWTRRGCRSLEEMASFYVERIREVQPAGPYRLFGASFGGLMAFEMALQLEAAGEQVERLALVDTAPPERTCDGDEDEAAAADPELPEALARRLEEGVREVFAVQKLAARRYLPAGQVRARILYFLCTGREATVGESPGVFQRARDWLSDRLLLHSRDPRLAWRRHAAGEIRFVPLPGEHGHFNREPQVSRLIAELQDALR